MIEKIAERTAKIKVGDPTDTATTMSAVINERRSKPSMATSRRAKPKAAASSPAAARTASRVSLSSRRSSPT